MKIRAGMSLSLVQRQQVRKATLNARMSMAKTKRMKTTKNSSKSLAKSGKDTSSLRTLLNNKLNAAETTSSTTKVDTTVEEKRASYKEMKNAAAKMQQYGTEFLAEGEKSLFAEETPREEVNRKILGCISNYNDMVTCMNKVDSSTLGLYLRQLKQYETVNNQAFQTLGISAEKDGTLSVKSEKFKEAELSDLKKVFHGKGSFLDEVAHKSKNIQSNAEYNLSNLSLVYSSGVYHKNGLASQIGGSTYQAKS